MRRNNGLRNSILALVLILVAVGIGLYVDHTNHGGSHQAGATTTTTKSGTPPSSTSWIVDAPDLNGLLAYAKGQPRGVALVTSVLDHPTTYVMTGTTKWPIPTINGPNTIPAGWDVTPAIITPDLAGVSQAASQHEAAIFDLELPVRPGDSPSEQANPGQTFATARSIMGSGTLIAVPGDNLAMAAQPLVYTQKNRFCGMEALNLPGAIAPHVNSYAVQAQGFEYDTATCGTALDYRSFVENQASQAKAVNPSVNIYSVLISLNSGGTYMTAQTMYDAASSVASQVKGFWLGMAILPYPWTTGSRALPHYAIPYQFLQMWAARKG